MFTLAFWLASKMLFSGRGFSFFVCGLVAMPFDLYSLLHMLGIA
jgi:hypothetical protein